MKRKNFISLFFSAIISFFARPDKVRTEETDYEKSYREFWKNIVEDDGVVNMDQIKRELHDYLFLLENVPKVYCEITGDKLSNPNYDAGTVISAFHEHIKELINEYTEEKFQGNVNDKEI